MMRAHLDDIQLTYDQVYARYSDGTSLLCRLRTPDERHSAFDSAALYRNDHLVAILSEETVQEPLFYYTLAPAQRTFALYIGGMREYTDNWVTEHTDQPAEIERLEKILGMLERARSELYKGKAVVSDTPPREYNPVI